MDMARYAADPEYREECLAKARGWKHKNKDRVRAYRQAYYARNKQTELTQNKRYRKDNREKVAKIKQKCDKEYRENNKEKIAARRTSKQYRENRNANSRLRYQLDKEYVLTCRLRASLSQAVRKAATRKKASTFELIGCSIQELVRHIENQFLPGMSWDNRKEWHIDHIEPVCTFDLCDPEQQKKCFHYTNLRPLWKLENLSRKKPSIRLPIRLRRLSLPSDFGNSREVRLATPVIAR